MGFRFVLNTYVGDYIVSTVGEYVPTSTAMRILAEHRGINLKGQGEQLEAEFIDKIGYVEIGFNRTYETMVFRAEELAAETDPGSCCPYRSSDSVRGYNDAAAAYRGHLEMCDMFTRRIDT